MRTTLLLMTIGGMFTAFGCSRAPAPPPFRPVSDVKQIMNAVVDPAADVIWNSVATIVTASGTEEVRPQTADEWTNVANHATIVAEAGNLLMMVPRAKDGGEWMKMAQSLVDTGDAAKKAAESRNAQALFDAGAEIYYACSNCHERYDETIKQAYPKGPVDVTK